MSSGEQDALRSGRGSTRAASALFLGARPVRSVKASDQIVEFLRSAIVSGSLPRGSRLPTERGLAQEFGVSQPTVREAVRVLEAMGLVEVRHGSGAYVAHDSQVFVAKALQTLTQIENVRILDVVDLRLFLAPYAASRAARCATPGTLAVVESSEKNLLDLSEGADFEELAPAMLALMGALSAAACQPLLFVLEAFLNELMVAFLVKAWRDDTRGFMRRWLDFSGPSEEQRQRLMAALRSGDEAAAAEAMAAHVQSQVHVVQSFPELAEVQAGDPDIVAILADDALRSPSYRELRQLAGATP